MELNISELATLTSLASNNNTDSENAFPIGESVFIRTVTFHYVGRVKSAGNGFLKLGEASWIADSGRFNRFLETGEADEVERYPEECNVLINSIVDWCVFPHELPTESK